jgi:hypothetical protein
MGDVLDAVGVDEEVEAREAAGQQLAPQRDRSLVELLAEVGALDEDGGVEADQVPRAVVELRAEAVFVQLREDRRHGLVDQRRDLGRGRAGRVGERELFAAALAEGARAFEQRDVLHGGAQLLERCGVVEEEEQAHGY